jgi:D-xylulose reductase
MRHDKRISSLQLCPKIVFAATPPHDGTLSRYYRIPAHNAHILPDNLTLEDGAMVSGPGIHVDAF